MFRLLCNGIKMLLSCVPIIIALGPIDDDAVDKDLSNEDQSQAATALAPKVADPKMETSATDKQMCDGEQNKNVSSTATNDSQTDISIMDLQRLIEMENRRDLRISVVEKGRRRPRYELKSSLLFPGYCIEY